MWTTYETCSYKVSGIKDRPFIGFDFDDTLVKLRTNEPLPNVKDKLEELYRDFNIVIFSNQNGVQKGKCTHELVRNNFDTFISKVNLPISVFYSIGNDIYRKPNIGMFTLFKQTCNKPLEWYCGDACGRRKDFSNSDLIIITLPTPKQELMSEMIKNYSKNYKILCVGGAVTMASGEEKQIPIFFDNYGLEFLWRLKTDTRRRIYRLFVSFSSYVVGLIFMKYKKFKKTLI